MMTRKYKIINNIEPIKIWVWALVSLVFICVFCYGFMVRNTIVSIVSRQNMDNQLAVLNSKVSDLEAQYIKMKNNVTPEMAYSLGFSAVTNQKFVTRDVKNSSLSLVTPAN